MSPWQEGKRALFPCDTPQEPFEEIISFEEVGPDEGRSREAKKTVVGLVVKVVLSHTMRS
jgi:hypothetical protein